MLPDESVSPFCFSLACSYLPSLLVLVLNCSKTDRMKIGPYALSTRLERITLLSHFQIRDTFSDFFTCPAGTDHEVSTRHLLPCGEAPSSALYTHVLSLAPRGIMCPVRATVSRRNTYLSPTVILAFSSSIYRCALHGFSISRLPR